MHKEKQLSLLRISWVIAEASANQRQVHRLGRFLLDSGLSQCRSRDGAKAAECGVALSSAVQKFLSHSLPQRMIAAVRQLVTGFFQCHV
jgi:hypothetical protein